MLLRKDRYAIVWQTQLVLGSIPTRQTGGSFPDLIDQAIALTPTSVNGFVIDPLNTSHLFASTDQGVYVSLDQGATWSLFGTGENLKWGQVDSG